MKKAKQEKNAELEANNALTVVETMPATAGDYRMVLIEEVHDFPLNPRPQVKDADLADLQRSIQARGIMQAPVVRERVEGGYEICAGWRRYICAVKLGMKEIEVKVETLTDRELVELALIENIHRRNLHPMNEARSMEYLIEQGATIDSLAKRIGQTPKYIARRLALCKLDDSVQKKFVADEISVGVALMAATLSDTKQQKDFVAKVVKGDDWGNAQGEMYSDARARTLYNDSFLLSLSQAGFSLMDETLVPEAGACSKCPHNSSNAPMLFEGVKSDAVCSKLSCFNEKKKAFAEIAIEKAKSDGAQFLDASKTPNLFYPKSSDLVYGSSYIDATDKFEHYTAKKKRKFSAIIGDKLTPFVCVDPTGKVRTLYPRAEAERIAAEQVGVALDARRSGVMTVEEDKKAKAEQKLKAKIGTEAQSAVTVAAATNAQTSAPLCSTDGQRATMRALVIDAIGHLWHDAAKRLAAIMEIAVPKQSAVGTVLIEHALSLTPESQFGFLAALAAVRSYTGPGSLNQYRAREKEVLELLDVDVKEIEKIITKRVKSEFKAKEALKKAKAGKKESPAVEAATAEADEAATAKLATKSKPKKAAKAAKTARSKKEAK